MTMGALARTTTLLFVLGLQITARGGVAVAATVDLTGVWMPTAKD